MGCFTFFSRKKLVFKKEMHQPIEVPGNVKLYFYEELRIPTEGFNPVNKVGNGGFGSVYKGTLGNTCKWDGVP